MTKQRSDTHRPGAIVPAHYTHWLTYSLPTMDGGWPIPAIGVDCATPYAKRGDKGQALEMVYPKCPDTGRCCVRSAERHVRATWIEGVDPVYGSTGKCGVCGAHFVYGSMFRHDPTGELVHMGHDCAQKYEAMYDLSAWELENKRERKAAAKHIKRTMNDRERQAFLDLHPGLEQDLALGNREGTRGAAILADLADKFTTYRSLSPKQIEFAAKLANEIRNPPPPKPEEIKVDAPTGKGIEFEGEIVSAKLHEGEWGSAWKVTIKVTTDAGVWLAWGTASDRLLVPLRERGLAGQIAEQLRGMRVTVKSSLERSDKDRSFVFMRRPTIAMRTYNHPLPPKARKPKAIKPAEPAEPVGDAA